MAMTLMRVRRGKDKIASQNTSTNTGSLRIAKDFNEMEPAEQACYPIVFPNLPNLLEFHLYLTISPSTNSYWRGGMYKFNFSIPPNYPHKPPKVTLDNDKCRIYHPNIDTDGNVCLNILKNDWTPVLDITQVFHGLQFLFLEPNPSDPLNLEAAEIMRNSTSTFERNVRSSFNGGTIDGFTYPTMAQIKSELTSLKNSHGNQSSVFSSATN